MDEILLRSKPGSGNSGNSAQT